MRLQMRYIGSNARFLWPSASEISLSEKQHLPASLADTQLSYVVIDLFFPWYYNCIAERKAVFSAVSISNLKSTST